MHVHVSLISKLMTYMGIDNYIQAVMRITRMCRGARYVNAKNV